jgi:hypothetical protein
MSTEFQLGLAAYEDGQGPWDSPYSSRTEEDREWQRGYEYAEARDRRLGSAFDDDVDD